MCVAIPVCMKAGLFYGWWVLAGLFVVNMITNGVVLNTLPLFYPEFTRHFGWDQSMVTQPAQLLFLAVAIFAPFAGAWLDRYSARNLMLAGCLIMTLGFLWYAYMGSLWEMKVIYLVFAIGITMAGLIPSMYIITRWFVRLRGFAVGILLIGSSLGGAIFNQVASKAIAAYGWSEALLLLGGISTALVAIPLLAIVRNKPEDMGLYADNQQHPTPYTATDVSASLSRALASPSLYLLLGITGALWFCIVGVIQHQSLFIKDLEIDRSAGDVLSLFFLSSIVGKLGFGWLGDRFSPKAIMLAAISVLAVGAGLLIGALSQPDTLLWAYALVFGIGFSGAFTMIQLLVAHYYSGPAYGKILGMFTMADTLAGVMGILMLGKIRTETGSYEQAFYMLLTVIITAAVAVLFLKKPIRTND